jgi:fructokinase
VAWHLRGFKADPLLVTAIGKDRDGEEILRRMGFWGLDTSGVQSHTTRPTGRVTARLQGDQPHYEIEARQAYDAMSVESLPGPRLLGRATLLYHGSLSLREDASAATLAFLRKGLGIPTFVDVNLRDPWWSMERTPVQIRGADWVKMNREEAGLLSRRPVTDSREILEAAEALRDRLEIRSLVVTLGSEGAMAVTDDEVLHQEAREISDTVDTVGAGDAFSAILALGVHRGWPLAMILSRASAFAGELCRIRGATSDDPELYSRYSERWDHAP